METTTKEHVWVKHVVTPVSVLDDGEGNPSVFVDPDKQAACEQNAAYGCMTCGESLAAAYGSSCAGETDE